MENSYTSTLRLKAALKDRLIGTAVNVRALRTDGAYRETLAREYNILTPENEMKFGELVKKPNVYDFDAAQEIVDFAKANDMLVRGHTLVWHHQNPEWLKPENYTRSQALDLLQRHIFTTAGHFRGDIYVWDVINEAVDRDGTLRDTFWLQTIGPEYLDYAFRWAREADPNARLFYNEYDADGLSPKSDGMYEMLKDLRVRGIPVDGVGLQMHLAVYDTPIFANPPVENELRKNINRLSDLNLEIHITELDVQIQGMEGTATEQLDRQARIYADIMRVALENPCLKAVITWGFTDRYSWIPSFTRHPDAPLPFDEYYQPKPAYEALYRSL